MNTVCGKKPGINGLHVRFDPAWYRRLVAMGGLEPPTPAL